jgi:hypothetical protein
VGQMQLRDWKYLQQNATRRDPAASACQSHKFWGVLNACASSSVAAALEEGSCTPTDR